MNIEREIAYKILRQLQMNAKIKYHSRYANLKNYKENLKRKLDNKIITQDYYESICKYFTERELELYEIDPTYEETILYKTAKNIFDDIDAYCKSGQKIMTANKQEIKFKDIPIWGTLDMPLFSAYICTEKNAENIILISSGMFLYAHLLCKAISQAFPIVNEGGKSGTYSTDYKKVFKRLKNNKIISVRFIDLILSYFVTNSAEGAKPYLIQDEYNNICNIFRMSFETFIIAHEYSHHILGHLDIKAKKNEISLEDIRLNQSITNLTDEVNADLCGALITIGVMGMHGIDRALSLVGILLAINTLIVFERLEEFHFNIKDDFMPFSPDHPSSDFRKKILLHRIALPKSPEEDLLILVDKVFIKLFDEFSKFTKKTKISDNNVDFYALQDILYKIYNVEN